MIYICYQPHAATAQGETKEPYDIKLSLGCLLDYSPSISNTHTHRPGHLLAEGGWEGWSLDLLGDSYRGYWEYWPDTGLLGRI